MRTPMGPAVHRPPCPEKWIAGDICRLRKDTLPIAHTARRARVDQAYLPILGCHDDVAVNHSVRYCMFHQLSSFQFTFRYSPKKAGFTTSLLLHCRGPLVGKLQDHQQAALGLWYSRLATPPSRGRGRRGRRWPGLLLAKRDKPAHEAQPPHGRVHGDDLRVHLVSASPVPNLHRLSFADSRASGWRPCPHHEKAP